MWWAPAQHEHMPTDIDRPFASYGCVSGIQDKYMHLYSYVSFPVASLQRVPYWLLLFKSSAYQGALNEILQSHPSVTFY